MMCGLNTHKIWPGLTQQCLIGAAKKNFDAGDGCHLVPAVILGSVARLFLLFAGVHVGMNVSA